MTEKVSIIMPNYNCGEYIDKTIDSVLAQTYENWELLVVDDCSTDNSVEIIKAFCEKDERIKLFINETNKGAAASRNRALREAVGRWIAFLDSDDLWLPQKLEKQLAFMVENKCSFSYTAYERIDEHSQPMNVVVTGPQKVTQKRMFRYCYPGCLTVMYDCSTVGIIQIPDAIGNGDNDYAIWLQVVKTHTCYFLNETLALYRVRENSLSHKSNKTKLLKNAYVLFRIGENKSAISAWFCMLRCVYFGFWKKVRYVHKQQGGEHE